jgi:hypothetical protein
MVADKSSSQIQAESETFSQNLSYIRKNMTWTQLIQEAPFLQGSLTSCIEQNSALKILIRLFQLGNIKIIPYF